MMEELVGGEEMLLPGTLRGFRSWDAHPSLGDGSATLRSTGVPFTWSPGDLTASCARGWPPPLRGPHPFLGGPCLCPVCRAMRPVTPDPAFSAEAHPAPVAGCSCGFYAWYQPGDTRLVRGAMFGAIAGSGRLQLGTHGYRAERAKLVAIAPSEEFLGSDPIIRELLASLALAGVRTFEDPATLVEAFPPDDISTVVQHECDPHCKASAVGRARQLRQAMSDAQSQLMQMLVTGNAFLQPPEPAPADPRRDKALEQRRSRSTGPTQTRKRWWQP